MHRSCESRFAEPFISINTTHRLCNGRYQPSPRKVRRPIPLFVSPRPSSLLPSSAPDNSKDRRKQDMKCVEGEIWSKMLHGWNICAHVKCTSGTNEANTSSKFKYIKRLFEVMRERAAPKALCEQMATIPVIVGFSRPNMRAFQTWALVGEMSASRNGDQEGAVDTRHLAATRLVPVSSMICASGTFGAGSVPSWAIQCSRYTPRSRRPEHHSIGGQRW